MTTRTDDFDFFGRPLSTRMNARRRVDVRHDATRYTRGGARVNLRKEFSRLRRTVTECCEQEGWKARGRSGLVSEKRRVETLLNPGGGSGSGSSYSTHGYDITSVVRYSRWTHRRDLLPVMRRMATRSAVVENYRQVRRAPRVLQPHS